MMMILILFSFGKKSENKKSDTPPKSPDNDQTVAEQTISVHPSKEDS